LQELFLQDKEDNVTVVNKGVFNDNSDLLMSRLEKDVIDEHPDFAIVEIGGNDCNFKWEEVAENPWEEHEAIVPLERYLDNIKKIIMDIQQNGITPIISTLPPLDPVRFYKSISEKYGSDVSHWISKVGGLEHWHGLYNRNLNRLAEELGVFKIDVRAAIKHAGDLTDLISDDGIHLTAEGYKALSVEIYQNVIYLIKTEKAQHI
jgi:lysophospholipase L1-like esterase